MKSILSISLNVILLFVFSTMTTTFAWACGGKGKCQKEVTERKTKYQKEVTEQKIKYQKEVTEQKTKYQKEVTEQKTKTKCPKDCCKKSSSDSKNKKKGCCGDDCSCSSIITIVGDLPKPLSIDDAHFYPVFNVENAFFYKQVSPKSPIQDILQPPISVRSI